MDTRIWTLLGYGVLPFWLLAGLVDYALHRHTDIAETSGSGETRLHLVQAVQVGLGVLVVLFLELNLTALAVIVAAAVAHTFTAYWDVRYASARRLILPLEQVVHAFLITLPLFGTVLLLLLHWPAVQASEALGDAGLRWRRDPWDAGVVATVLGASVVLGMLPALLEYRQARRVAARSTSDRPSLALRPKAKTR